MPNTKTITYEARLKKRIERPENLYKKGHLIQKFTEKEFKKLQKNGFKNWRPKECFGHGCYDYFSFEDIEFYKTTRVINITERLINA